MVTPDVPERPQDVPPAVWSWMHDLLRDPGARLGLDPLVGVVLAAAHQRRQQSGPIPDDVLRGWSRLLDAGRRQINQCERSFIEETRAAGWDDNEIKHALCIDAETDLDERVTALNAMIYEQIRPPTS
jgi:hypothetical protein